MSYSHFTQIFGSKSFRKENRLTQIQLVEYLGVTQAFISQIEKGDRPTPNEYITKIQADGIYKIPEPKKQVDAVFIENPNIIMIPLVSQYAYAGYLSGYTDSEYMEALPKVPMFVDHESKGTYIVFEVRGDSMEEDSRDGIFQGDKLYCREIKKDLWKYKLHIKQWDFVIVHKTEGILIKRITEHDPETGVIKIYSLNPIYDDKY